jgi:hypothetical protein
MHEIINTCQPIKIVKKKDDKPWMTDEIKILMKKRQRLFHNDQQHEWKQMAKQVKCEIWKRKRQYYSKFTNKDQNWWKVINKIRNDQSETSNNSTSQASTLNDYFSSVWSNCNQTDISEYTKKSEAAPEQVILSDEVLHELQSLKIQKSIGPDGLSACVLKGARVELCEIVTHLFNLNIQHSLTPSQWKDANILPIPKTSHPASPAEFRPIALT